MPETIFQTSKFRIDASGKLFGVLIVENDDVSELHFFASLQDDIGMHHRLSFGIGLA